MMMNLSVKMYQCCWVGALLALGAISATNAWAKVHSDFDPGGTYFGGDEGWFNYDGNPGFGIATPAGSSTQWLAVQPQQYWGKITSQSWATPDITIADWNSHTHLEFDVMVDDLWFPSGTATIDIEFQVDGGDGGTINQYAHPTIDTSLKNVVQHVSVPLAGLQPFDPTATTWNLSLNLFPGYAWEWDTANPAAVAIEGRYFIDNVEWTGAVPEPTSLVLLGSCGLMLWGARRKRG